MVALTYHVLLTYIIYYFIVSWISIATGLPWASCDNDWNTYKCLTADKFANKTFLEGFLNGEYRQTSTLSRTLVGKTIADHSDLVGASPVGAAPTTSLFST